MICRARTRSDWRVAEAPLGASPPLCAHDTASSERCTTGLPTPSAALSNAQVLLARAVTENSLGTVGLSAHSASVSSNRLDQIPPDTLVCALVNLGLQAIDAEQLHTCLPDLLKRGKEVKLAFWTDQMCERGTEVALFDYADFSERILGYSAFVLYDSRATNNYSGAVAKFTARFGERVLGLARGWSDVDAFLASEGIEFVYAIKCNNDGLVSKLDSVRTCIHAVFDAGDPYGDVYAKISPCVPGACPVVPHIVRAGAADGDDMRAELGIPRDATVFGRYGGYESFDVEVAREAVLEVARGCSSGSLQGADIYFVLMNTPPLCEHEPRIVHVHKTSDDGAKARFIRTCDAMIHARSCGETFGLAVGEFSAHNRPVITSATHTNEDTARFHLDVLGKKGLYYSSREELVRIFLNFDRVAAKLGDHNAYRSFEPAVVMRTFANVFIHGKRRREVPEWKRWTHRGGRSSQASHTLQRDKRSRAEMYEEWKRMKTREDELGELRGLPKEAETAAPPNTKYRVTSRGAAVAVRLAPSTSAAAVDAHLSRGQLVEVSAFRGLWVRVAPPEAGPRWALTCHPDDGELLAPA